MAYTKPVIDDTGIHIPTYADIRDSIIASAKQIYGSDIYLGTDSQDYQFIATISEKMYDSFQLAVDVYNNKSPVTALTNALDSLVKINGIKRHGATYSTVPVTISGIQNTTITNGIVLDTGNIKWDLPSTVTIPESGTITVIATCEISGPIVANVGEITGIYNPVYGWNGVYNSQSATLGSEIESDSKLRKRQATSTAQPSKTVLEGTRGAVASVDGVTRSEVYENDTDITDSRGLPPHSITAVVENGLDTDIAQAIFTHKGPGCYTNGDVEIEVTDSEGEITPIRFYRVEYVDIDVVVNVKALNNYTTATTSNIKNNLETYLNSLKIGANLNISSLWGAALQAISDLKNPIFSITSLTAAKHGETQGTDEIDLIFKEITRGDVNYITVNVV
jgi:uncharacterized phage protein gp47/JayE